jgi:hypothetical protein
MLHSPVARSRSRGDSPAAATPRSPAKSPEAPGAMWKHLSLLTSTAVGETAKTGTRGTGEPLPHRERLASSFGPEHDLSSIRAHVGGASATACRDLGAKAYASGSSVAFRSSPDLWLAAHETAHVLQQRGGQVAANESDHRGAPAERRADAIADRVVAGRSAADLLPADRTRTGAGDGAAVQRYTREPVGAGTAQVGSGRQTALLGTQSLYAAPGLVAGANSKLQNVGKQGSYIELKSEGGSVTVDGNSLPGVQPHFIAKPGSPHSQVEGANAPGGTDTEGNADGPIALWTDCGRASATVTGSSGGSDRSVVYKENGVAKVGKGVDDPSVSGWLKSGPNRMANQVYMDLLPGFIQRPDNASFLVEGVHFDKRGFSVGRAIVGGIVGAVVGTLAAPGLGTILGAVGGAATAGAIGSSDRVHRKPKTILEAKMMYLALGNAGMDKFDKEAGINHYANPEVGESYSMATEGDMPGFNDYGKSPWNYHWAGVIMKDGGDNITLENYAVGTAEAASKGVAQRDYIDRKWNFAMYGTTDQNQTFHKEHLDSQTHGSKATSIVVRTDK